MKRLGKYRAILAAVLLAAIIISGGCFADRKDEGDDAAVVKPAAPSAPATVEKPLAAPKQQTPATTEPAAQKEPVKPTLADKTIVNEPAVVKDPEVPAQYYAYAPSAPVKPATPDPGSIGTGRGRLAIVIDDFGYRSSATERILALNYPITCAVLPDGKTTAEDGRAAYEAGKLVILHMPMEAQDYKKSDGEGFIRVGMEPGEVRARLHVALESVPMAKGVSNHMGSLVSRDEAVLEALIEEVDYLGLFYLDSRTAADTLGPQVAERLGAKAYMNSTFIDSVDDAAYVEERLWVAADRAKAEGQAVAIGHVKLSTAKALEKVLPMLKAYGVELVFVNQLDPL